ncbi:MAG: hypothetical protein KME12_20435 [Trichocoleus desertorum ATA4-8-CV12]|nr:hypothetical protein [Trichocoleus desertorum ATA4-8-CV12]
MANPEPQLAGIGTAIATVILGLNPGWIVTVGRLVGLLLASDESEPWGKTPKPPSGDGPLPPDPLRRG